MCCGVVKSWRGLGGKLSLVVRLWRLVEYGRNYGGEYGEPLDCGFAAILSTEYGGAEQFRSRLVRGLFSCRVFTTSKSLRLMAARSGWTFIAGACCSL